MAGKCASAPERPYRVVGPTTARLCACQPPRWLQIGGSVVGPTEPWVRAPLLGQPGDPEHVVALTLQREIVQLIAPGRVEVCPGSIALMAARSSAQQLAAQLPKSQYERDRLRARYAEFASASLSREGFLDLRALDQALCDAAKRRRIAPRCAFENSRDDTPLPQTATACRREILARFADPRCSVHRHHVEGVNTEEIYGYDVVVAVERGWCITAIPRPEILAIDFDGGRTWNDIVTRFVDVVEAEGGLVCMLPSGRAIRDFIDCDSESRMHALGIGIHVLCLCPSASRKVTWSQLAEALGGDVRTKTRIRLPAFVGKNMRVPAVGRAAEYVSFSRDASNKRLYAAAFGSVSNLQGVVDFLRRAPRWSDQGLFDPLSHDRPAAEWVARSYRVRPADQGPPRPGAEPVRQISRHQREGRSTDVNRSSDHAASNTTPSELSQEARLVLERGDTRELFRKPDGTVDRSQMGIWLIWQLRRAQVSREQTLELVAMELPGLAAYWQRRDGDRLFEHDWEKVELATSSRDGVEEALDAALKLDRPLFRCVAVAMCGLGRRSAPGVRKLSEITGYSVRSVWLALQYLDGRIIRKVGPKRGPGDRCAQGWALLPPRLLRARLVNTKKITPNREGEREAIRDAMKKRVPLTLLVTQRNGITWPLPRSAARALRERRDWVKRACARHRAQREQYKQRLRRAGQRGTPFPSPAAAYRRRDRFYCKRLRQCHDQAMFLAVQARAMKRLPRQYWPHLAAVQSPNERLNAMHREWYREEREHGRVEPWLHRKFGRAA